MGTEAIYFFFLFKTLGENLGFVFFIFLIKTIYFTVDKN
ncbi:hypothetical protein LACDD01_01922 [Lactococcus sp. DD01]|nr:hypothetical protein LACDD01_01922 [Lactococcus sp. DD01]